LHQKTSLAAQGPQKRIKSSSGKCDSSRQKRDTVAGRGFAAEFSEFCRNPPGEEYCARTDAEYGAKAAPRHGQSVMDFSSINIITARSLFQVYQ